MLQDVQAIVVNLVQEHSVNNNFSRKDIKDEEREKGRRRQQGSIYDAPQKGRV